MDNFNFNRFVRTMTWCFYEQRGKLLKWSAIAMIVTFAVEMFFVFMLRNQADDMASAPAYQAAVDVSSIMSLLFIMIAVMVANSNIFDWMKSKQKRAAYLTLPATNLERWTSAFIFALVIFPVSIFLAYILGDLLRNGLLYLLGEQWLPRTKSLLHMYGVEDGASGFDVKKMVMGLWGSSCFIVMGTWFRKGQFVITASLQVLLMAILMYVVKTYHNEIAEMIVNDAAVGSSSALRYGVSIFFFLVAIFNFWLSFRLFKRFQIISSNWFNL
ncbi:MAG: hypothetical protein IKQ77_08025 [Prevotella sp.]|nr:hypothetical protein [Prevotella sp.]